MSGKTLAQIKAYLQGIKPLFIEGNVKLVSEGGYVKIAYKDNFIDFTIKEKLPFGDEEALTKVVGFCFDCYSDYEWKGETLNSETIGRLLLLRPGSVRSILSKIYKKLYIYGEPILQEKQEVETLQNNQQGADGGMISEEQGARDTGEEKERIEMPLW